ncbi:hypothetical protein [Clostridium butyricum]|uniref:ISCpe5, transposase n=1 Tax=Clostridium butyricum E4 str. BoNT E BL5262 TaxID=632245 RepID=C4IHV6_CLOBU|nr:hypothetical protein [Clostridium butyricum]APF22656.1 putative iSCpe5, transposase [Clostridium butyricum]EDT76510.1 ISCpe5, transposase [Clostridium butyricum 5521]EEP54133.1 ISCpe5, transposase [Clostridium butyricum E4 str. BoNT E BL5262]NFL32775.1 hypothetical protein [Clostridium butyricum]NFS18703.1 hypothetical protein [Clostridium butyricum]
MKKIINKCNIIPIHQIGFPISFENIIPDDDSVRVLYDVMEGLDYTELKRTYSTMRDVNIRVNVLKQKIINKYM